MTKKEIKNLIKLKKDRLTLAQLYKDEFIQKLSIQGFEDFINSELEELKALIKQLENLNS